MRERFFREVTMGVTQMTVLESGAGLLPFTRRVPPPLKPLITPTGPTSSEAPINPATQLRGWITLLLGRSERAVPIGLDEEGYVDVAGQRCAEEAPPFLRMTSRLARFERQRRAARMCERRLEEEGPKGRALRMQRAQCEHLLKVAHESRMRLRDEAWALGGRYHEFGVDAERVEPAVTEAVDRMLQLVAVSDRQAESALAHDLVRWGQQGYHAAASRA